MKPSQLVLGVDAGGTKTVAWLAVLAEPTDEPVIVGRGTAGPANPQAIGFDKTFQNLDRAVDAAFDRASIPTGSVAAAVVALAGSDRDDNRRKLRHWADRRQLANRLRIVHDALPVLAAGSPGGWGVALISGTGSLAFGQTQNGRVARAGGWGFLFGDEGSAYAVALAGLRAAAKSADGRAPATQLLDAMLERLECQKPEELVLAIYPFANDRARIAALAEVVVEAADQGDAQARHILAAAANELTIMIATVAKKLTLDDAPFPLALTGGLLLGSNRLRREIENHIGSLGLSANPIAIVEYPVAGSVRLAQAEGMRSG